MFESFENCCWKTIVPDRRSFFAGLVCGFSLCWWHCLLDLTSWVELLHPLTKRDIHKIPKTRQFKVRIYSFKLNLCAFSYGGPIGFLFFSSSWSWPELCHCSVILIFLCRLKAAGNQKISNYSNLVYFFGNCQVGFFQKKPPLVSLLNSKKFYEWLVLVVLIMGCFQSKKTKNTAWCKELTVLASETPC